MTKPRRERYKFLKAVIAAGSVCAVMLAWMGFSRSGFEDATEAGIEVALVESVATATPFATTTPASAAASSSTQVAEPTPTAATAVQQARRSRGS